MIVVLVATAGVGGAVACGPFFPWQLLDNREEALAAPIHLRFDHEAARLVPEPRDGMTPAEPSDGSGVVEAEQAELRHTTPDGRQTDERLAALAAARAAPDAAAALAAAAILPVAVGEYIAGAVEFKAGRWAVSAEHFAAIDRLPPEDRRSRAVAAAYMRGRIGQSTGDFDAARAAFQETRARARRDPDPMGLGVASLGEEARLDLIDAALADDPWETGNRPALGAELQAKLIARAIGLYAEQAARGSKIALVSLAEVAEKLNANLDMLTQVVADPIARRLIVAYATAGGDSGDFAPTTVAAENVVAAVLGQMGAGDDFDRVAALAYQAGRYDEATKLVSATTRPLGLWVRAKLALRRGDREAAVRDWKAAVAQSLPGIEEAALRRMQGELAVVRLSQGEYRDSLQVLMPVAKTYWGDVAYIAERVLTVDELKAFVDGLPPDATRQPGEAPDDIWFPPFGPHEGLRALLGRRLIREGRLRDAIAYFPAPAERAPSDDPQPSRATSAEAGAYALAVEAARAAGSWQGISRAEALFAAAKLARSRGMELMGTEGPPDEAVIGGAFPAGIGQMFPQGGYVSSYDDEEAQRKARAEIERRSAFLGPDELARFAASAPKPDVRFHYRQIAVDQALAAADLLPHGSQAYAATLCWTARFAFALRNEAGDRLAAETYRRYVKTGAYQPWVKHFGRTCPEPDFEAARDYWPKRIAAWPAKMVGKAWRHPAWSAAGIAVVLLLAGAAWTFRRRSPR